MGFKGVYITRTCFPDALSYLGLTVLGLVPVGPIRATGGFVLLIAPEWCFCCGSLLLVLMYASEGLQFHVHKGSG